MTRVDLDALGRDAAEGLPDPNTVLFAVDELRAAREVVKDMREMRHYLHNGSLKAAAMLAASSLEKHDEAVGS